MGWRDHVAYKISKNTFLRNTTTFDSLSAYVKKEILRLQSELLAKSNSGGSLFSITNEDGSIDYVIPYVGGHGKGFQVKYDREAAIIILQDYNDGNENPLSPLVSIEPHSHGAIVKYLDAHEKAGEEEVITPSSLDEIFEKTLT